MPADMSRYPRNWRAISQHIRFERAGGRCECFGECGLAHNSANGRCTAVHGEANPRTRSVVVLTTAHLGVDRPDGSPGDPQDVTDVRHENLRAMCQQCHLRMDAELHRRNAAETRRRQLVAAGQMELFR